EVRFRFVGTAIGVKQDGGVLDTVITELQVSCAPENIPDVIEIDVTNLQMGDSLSIGDIVFPEGVTPLAEPERLVVSVLPPQINAEDEIEAEAEAVS
ncbi:MAG: 50S ribosomal protein L25, partial [Nostoc sp.]